MKPGPQRSDFFRHMPEFSWKDGARGFHHPEFSTKYGGMGNAGWVKWRIETIRQPGRFDYFDGGSQYERRKDTK